MSAHVLWNIFVATGSPEIYLLYRKALTMKTPASA